MTNSALPLGDDPVVLWLGVSRRRFIEWVIATSGLAYLGCPGSTSSDSGPRIKDAFLVWEQLRAALRQSPDHLIGAAERAVASKDPAAIFIFVRDQIAVLAPQDTGYTVEEIRWGTRATLRGGAGTPREKVELLAELYRRAGFEASVVYGSPTDALLGSKVLLRSIARPFAPPIDAATVSKWMGMIDRGPAKARIDPDDSERAALARAVAALLPAGLTSRGRPEPVAADNRLTSIPLVAVKVEGQIRYASPLVPDAAFGASTVNSPPNPADPQRAALPIHIELAIGGTIDPGKKTTVLKADLTAADIAGRQLVLTFVPDGVDAAHLGRLRASDVNVVRPVLSARGLDLDAATEQRLTWLGTTFTTGGEVVERAPDGTVTVAGRPIAIGTSDPGAARKVRSLTATAFAGAFPTVRLEATALDADGQTVPGLSADSFQIRDQGRPEPTILLGVPAQPFRVGLIIDADDPLDTGEDLATLARELTRRVVAAYPDATILVAGGDVRTPTPFRDPEAVVSAIGLGDQDDIWFSLVEIAALSPTVILAVSDFAVTRMLDAHRTSVALGPPVIAVGVTGAGSPRGVSTPLPPAFNEIVALTRGQALNGSGVQTAVQAVLDFLAARRRSGPYVLEYTAPSREPPHRTVSLSIAGGSASGMTSYDVPSAAQQIVPIRLAGLHLTVSVGDRKATRVLAGNRGISPDGIRPPVPTEKELAEVFGALFGATILSFEGGAPPFSVLLDDLLSMKLATKPLWDAIDSGDTARMRDALASVRSFVPPVLLEAQVSLTGQTEGTVVFESGLRTVAFTVFPNFRDQLIEKRLDILPLARFAATGTDAAATFQSTLAATTRLAVIEAHLFEKSTKSVLAGRTLFYLRPGGTISDQLDHLPIEARRAAKDLLEDYRGYHRLIPASGALDAFWAVHQDTGDLLGVLRDGTGGGAATAACKSLKTENALLDTLSLLADLAGAGSLGAYFALGKAVAAAFTLAGIVLANISDPNFDYDPEKEIRNLVQGLACNLAKAGVSGAVAPNPLGTALVRAETAAEIGGGGIANCPSARGSLLTC